MSMNRFLVVLATTLTSITALANDKVSVFVEYRHAAVHVHYSLPCAYKSTCTLTSLEGADVPWRVEVTPNKLENGIVAVTAVVQENSQEVSRSNVLNKLGEESKIVSKGLDGESSELTIRPYLMSMRVPYIKYRLSTIAAQE